MSYQRPGIPPCTGFLCVCALIAADHGTAWGITRGCARLYFPSPSKNFPSHTFIIPIRWGVPFHTIIRWGTMTPTAASLHEHHDKKHNPSYAGSFHRTLLLSVLYLCVACYFSA